MKHITIRGKPICACHFSDAQHVALVNAAAGRFNCSYDETDPKLEAVVSALKGCVKDPATVEVKDGECPMRKGPQMQIATIPCPKGTDPAKVVAEFVKHIKEKAGGTPGRGNLPAGLPPGLPPGPDAPPDDDSSSFAA